MPRIEIARRTHRNSFSRRSFLHALGLTGGLPIFAGMIGCGGGGGDDGAATPQEYRLAYALPPDADIPPGYVATRHQVRVSPDGSLVVLRGINRVRDVGDFDGSVDDIPFGALVRHTNYGQPGASETSVVRRFAYVNEQPRLAVSPGGEIYLRSFLLDDKPNKNDTRIAVLAPDGSFLRKIPNMPSGFGASGDFYTNLRGGVYRARGGDGEIRYRVLEKSPDVSAPLYTPYFSDAAVVPGEEVWSFTDGGFFAVAAATEGTEKRLVSVREKPYPRWTRVTRSDGAGDLYIDAEMPEGFSDYVVPGEEPTPLLVSYVRKYDRDGTLLAAIPVGLEAPLLDFEGLPLPYSRQIGLLDFDVDPAGNVYMAAEHGVFVYRRVR